MITKLRWSAERQILTYAQKRLKTLAEELVRDRIYGLLTYDISSVHCAVFPFFVHPSYFELINEKILFVLNNPLSSLQILSF